MPYGKLAQDLQKEAVAKRKAALKAARELQKKTDALINPGLKA